MPRGWSRAIEEEGSSKLVSPFLKGKRESKLDKGSESETAEASTIESRKKEDVKTEENGEAETRKDADEAKEAKVDLKSGDSTGLTQEMEETKVNGHETKNGDKNGSAVDEEHASPAANKGKGKGNYFKNTFSL